MQQQNQIWTSLLDGDYGRDRVHAAQANPAWELKPLLPMGDKRYKFVRVKDNFAWSVNDITPLPAQKTKDEAIAEKDAEIAALKAQLADAAAAALKPAAPEPAKEWPASESDAEDKGEIPPYRSMKWADLRSLCSKLSLPAGRKDEMIAVLDAHYGVSE